MKTTILGGVLFLVPFAVILIVFGKAYQISTAVAAALKQVFPLTDFGGIVFANIFALVLIVTVCYLAGLAAKTGFMAGRMEKLDGFLIDVVPGYAVAKSILGSVAQEDDMAALLTPVLVRFDDYDQVAFEIENDGERCTLFLPGAPTTWTGTTVIVNKNRVKYLPIPAHQTVKLMRVLGRGSLAVSADAVISAQK